MQKSPLAVRPHHPARKLPLLSLAATLTGLVAGCGDAPPTSTAPATPQPALLRAAQSATSASVPARGADLRTPLWTHQADSVLWAHAVRLDTLFTIGIKAPGAARGYWRGRRLVDAETWHGAARALLAQGNVRIVAVDSVLPLIEAKIGDLATLSAIRRLGLIDYVEPTLTAPSEIRLADSGCDYPTAGAGLAAADSYGDLVSQSYRMMLVDRAWLYAPTAGAGVTVGLTDTGVDTRHPDFTALGFSSGMSGGRWFQQKRQSNYTGLDYPTCSHGSRMAAVIASPRNAVGAVGVAYRANLFDSWMQNQVTEIDATNQRQGIRDAKDAGAKVITMAWNTEPLTTFARSGVDDEINEGYYGRDIVFVGAAGTTFGGNNNNNVVWPAEKVEVIAVSAANFDGTRSAASHYGPELDLVVYSPSATVGPSAYGAGAISELAQSSSGAAIVSGVAALIRGKYPSLNTQGVRDRLVSTAGTTCGKATTFGPIINAEAAVGGLCVQGGKPSGPSFLYFDPYSPSTQTVSYSVTVSGGSGSYQISWNGAGMSYGGTGNSMSYTFARPAQPYTSAYWTVRATITDLGNPSIQPLVLELPVELYYDGI